MKTYDVVIIGKGPAGISASLYACRGGVSTLIIYKDGGALGRTDKIDNYYGFAETIDGDYLLNNGVKQATRLGVEFLKDEVVGIGYENDLVIKCKGNNITAKTVMIATGTSRNRPKIGRVTEFEGKGVSYCAVCDAFFYRGKNVFVIGSGDYALHEAIELKAVVNNVTILTNGKDQTFETTEGINVIKTPIKTLTGDDVVGGVEFEDGTTMDTNGIFIAIGMAGSTDLAKKIGAEVDGNKIVVNKKMQTNIPGLYAGGDCVGGMFQIAKAVYDGANAGIHMLKEVRKK